MRKLIYYAARREDDSTAYNIRERKKKDALKKRNDMMHGSDRIKFGPIAKVVIEYEDAFDLMFRCLGEGGVECELPFLEEKPDPMEETGMSKRTTEKPVPSPNMILFFQAEDRNCDDSGEKTTLDTAHNSLIQMPDDALADILRNPVEELDREKFNAEFEAILKTYGPRYDFTKFDGV